MPRMMNKKDTQSGNKQKRENQDAILDQVDESVDCLIDDVVDDTDTYSDLSDDSNSDDFDDHRNIEDNTLQHIGAETNVDKNKGDNDGSCEQAVSFDKSRHRHYTRYDKEVMVKRISRLQREEHKVINRIIKNHDPDKKKQKVTGGAYITFHNLNDMVYYEIDKYLEELAEKNKEDFQRYMTETDNIHNSTEDNVSSDIDSSTNVRYRLSNREKHMLNRQRFDKIRTDEIQESIRMNHKKRDVNRSDRQIDLTSSDKRIKRTINIGTSDINSVFDTLGHDKIKKEKGPTINKRTKSGAKEKKTKNIFSKNK